MPSSDLIIIDDVPSYRQVALVRDGQLDQIWHDDTEKHPYQTGAIVAVRINQIFEQHNRMTVTLDGITASLRLSANRNYRPGDLIAAKVKSMARDDGFSKKPLQLTEASQIKNVPSSTGLMTPAPDALARAKAVAPDASIIEDDDGQLWQYHALDQALEQALRPDLDLEKGGRIIISTPPGAAIIDGDSGDTRLAPIDLAKNMIPAVMHQLRLRRIGGPIVIDFPRLDQDEKKMIHNLMRAESTKDKITLHGFTRGGLYTLTRPWQDYPLAEARPSFPRKLGLEVLRQIRIHQAKMTAGPLNLRLHQDGIDWLNGAGGEIFEQLKASKAFQVRLFPDNLANQVMIEEKNK